MKIQDVIISNIPEIVSDRKFIILNIFASTLQFYPTNSM